jgi:hypothetical protein
MGIRPEQLSDQQWKLVAPAQRKRYGKTARTFAEIDAATERKNERADHDQFINYCNLKGISYIHANPTRKSTIRVGWPDFSLFFCGRVAFIEFKGLGRQLTHEQDAIRRELEANGFFYFVAHSLSEAIDAVQTYFFTYLTR